MSATATILLQAAILILTLGIILSIFSRPKQALNRNLRTKPTKTTVQSSRHVAQATLFLSKANSPQNPHALTLAKTALHEAEQAVSLSPRDPKPLILKSMALELMGRENLALRSLDLALSVPRVKSLSWRERGEALVKRAELKIKVNKKRRIDSAVEDLEEGVKLLSREKSVGSVLLLGLGFCLLGECYGLKGNVDEAKWAFEEALRVEPECIRAREGLDLLGS